MINTELIASKLADMEGYLGEISVLLAEDRRILLEDLVKLRAVERLFQLIVDTAIDINTHIIVASGFHMEYDYQSTVTTLGTHAVLPAEFALKIAPSVGLRNQVVHKYGRVDIKCILDQIKKEISDYALYIKHIHNFSSREIS